MKFIILIKDIFILAPVFGILISDVFGVEQKEFGADISWPKYNHFGQISGVGVDNSGRVYVFHRVNRIWDASTFSKDNVFINKNQGPIPNETIVVLDPNDGSALKKTGANLFYLPHGLTIDDDNNVWLTDVALHQVFKFPAIDFTSPNGGLGKAQITLGVPLEPGSDKMHFCKPTGVAVDKQTKEFYVSDGYCNARIIKYDQYGNVLLTLGRSSIGFPQLDYYMLSVPHALALAQDKQTLFVADRENLRALSYDFQTGKFKKAYGEELRSRIFSIAYSSFQDGLLFVLTNDNFVPKMVAVYKVDTGKLIFSFSPKNNFTNPHDLAVSPDGNYCYVVELNPYKIWKFKLDKGVIPQINQNSYNEGDKTSEKQSKSVQEPMPAESKIDKATNSEASSSFLAVALVVSVVMLSFLFFMFHYYKRKGGSRRYETRRLILDDDEGGIRLT